MQNHFIKTHPGSYFAHNLVVALQTPQGGRRTLLNGRLRVFGAGGVLEEERSVEGDDAALEAVLEEYFGLSFKPQ